MSVIKVVRPKQSRYSILIKRIRSEHKETMGDMADWLKVSLPFVSAVENGRKRIPDDWYEKISKHYQLSNPERQELSSAILESQKYLKINLVSASNSKKALAIQFQRSFDDMDDNTAEKISEILKGEK